MPSSQPNSFEPTKRRALALRLAVAFAFAVAAVGVSACGCGGDSDPPFKPFEDAAPTHPGEYEWTLPPGFPVPAVPDDSPMSDAKVELGRHLFFETDLSGNQVQSCGSCHLAENGFAEPETVSMGSTGEFTPRNSMSLVNVAYNSTYTWHSPLLLTLEQQILIPLFGDFPVEMGLREDQLFDRLSASVTYREMFASAFPGEGEPITTGNTVRAIASFVRTMISGNSPFDKLTYQDDQSAMTDSAKRGLDLFLSEQFECHHCHSGFNFSLATTWQGQSTRETGFFNTGLYNIDGEGGYPAPNVGLIEFSLRPQDAGKFRAPTLRNIMLTAPYLHDGSAATIDDVLDIYAAGGRNVETGPNAGRWPRLAAQERLRTWLRFVSRAADRSQGVL